MATNIRMIAISGISLLVGGIGIMNMMLTAVRERTREIGIRTATGAMPGDILRQFLIEAMVVSGTGGVVGLTIGIAIGAAAAYLGATVILSATSAALALLSVVTWLIYKSGMRLPLKQFFTASAAIMVVLAFIFAGKGIAALQEAGSIPSTPVGIPTIELLGIYPSAQALALQALVVLLAVAVVVYERMQAKSA